MKAGSCVSCSVIALIAGSSSIAANAFISAVTYISRAKRRERRHGGKRRF